ncbi:MAG TPA: hypothetical protein VLC50_01330 [Actinomycetes bacterium]|nr:hypothetical protein [Actinomycetes bacterium]
MAPMTDGVEARYPDPMAGYRTLARLLGVGLLAGAVIGGAVGTIVVGLQAYALFGLLAGATVGMVAGVVTQGLTFTVLLVARRAAPALSRRAAYVVIAAIPVATAGGLARWAASAPSPGGSDGSDGMTIVVTAVAVMLAVAAVMLAASWCLAPLLGRQHAPRP